jgi:hypothetical protein
MNFIKQPVKKMNYPILDDYLKISGSQKTQDSLPIAQLHPNCMYIENITKTENL